MPDDIYFSEELVDNSPIAVKYHDTKDSLETKPDDVLLLEFANVVSIDPQNAKWCFKAYRQMVKIYCRLGEYEKMMDASRKMLKYIKGKYQGDSVYRFLQSLHLDLNRLQKLYEITVEALEENKNQYMTVWFRTSLELCNVLFENRQYTPISKILNGLHKYCQKEDGTSDEDKTRDLRKVYAVEFQLYTETDDNINQKMQELYRKALAIKPDARVHIDHKTIGLLHECGGKMYMAERQWTEASVAFRAAFTNYCKDNNQRYIKCLKFDLLASMMGSNLAPFDTLISEGKWSEFGLALGICANHPEILALKASIDAYQNQDFEEFERALKSNLEHDTIISRCMQDMLQKMRTQAILNLLEPCTTKKIGISFISTKLGVTEDEAMELLRLLILNNGVHWLVDEVEGYVVRVD
ncbi:PREDICTED: COP9 signalosome complex subunit 2-like [Brassica oleracea var. oleracea]|uniref:PCI domain-containing protein n=1 Tax=Brassica oleracea var. oleracea TaxID=109376 RepID=A0A0D3BBW8_BRAOL|nr:PREDICTED: COP9 signalosome complex subunit 2-like [Brassica oleracea var. oleracea]